MAVTVLSKAGGLGDLFSNGETFASIGSALNRVLRSTSAIDLMVRGVSSGGGFPKNNGSAVKYEIREVDAVAGDEAGLDGNLSATFGKLTGVKATPPAKSWAWQFQEDLAAADLFSPQRNLGGRVAIDYLMGDKGSVQFQPPNDNAGQVLYLQTEIKAIYYTLGGEASTIWDLLAAGAGNLIAELSIGTLDFGE